MKVLQLTVHYYPNVGGVETHLNDLVKGLVDSGNEVFVLTYNPLTTNISAKPFEKKRQLTVLRLPWFTGFFYKLVKNPFLEFLYLTPLL